MQPDRQNAAHLWDMLVYARTTERLVHGKDFAEYEANETLRLAVERAIEVVGEAARRVETKFRNAHPEVPWRPIMAQRNVLAHDYGEIINSKIWKVATVHVPALIAQLETLVPVPPPDPEP